MKRVLIVSPHFPPANAPDMQRVRVSLPYFVQAGWDVTVLTVDDPTPTAPLEPELEATVPAGVRIERVHCLSRRWTGWFGLNNVALRALPFLFRAGCRLLAGRRYDVVYFSTTMFIVLPFGRIWKMFYGVPYVIDLQDPWVSDYYDRPGVPRPPGGWKYSVAQALGRALEGWTMRGVSHLIVVSQKYLDVLRARYPELQAMPGTELPFGAPDPDLRVAAKRMASRAPLLPPGGVRLAFAGALGPGMLVAVEVLFAGLAAARQAGVPVSAHFFGTSYSSVNAVPATLDLAARAGVAEWVHETPGRLRYFDALQVTLEADANLLFGSTDLAFTPSKTLALLATGRPVVALAPSGSALVGRLAALGQTCVVFPAAGPDEASRREVATLLRAVATDDPARTQKPRTGDYGAQACADRQLEILARVSRRG